MLSHFIKEKSKAQIERVAYVDQRVQGWDLEPGLSGSDSLGGIENQEAAVPSIFSHKPWYRAEPALRWCQFHFRDSSSPSLAWGCP